MSCLRSVRVIGLLGLLGVGLLSSGCDNSFKRGFLDVRVAKRAPKDYAHVFKAKRPDSGTTVRLRGRRFYAPWRIEGVVGAGSEKQPDFSPGFVGMSMLAADFVSPGYYAVEVRSTGTGLEVSARDGTALGTLSFPDVSEVQVAIEHNGTDVIFEARASALEEFREVGRVGAVTQGPLVASLDANDLPRKAQVAWDDLRVPLASPPPPGENSDLIHTTHLALDRMLDAFALSDDGGPDIPAARDQLVQARSKVESAAGLAPSGPPALVKRLGKAGKKIDQAVRAIDQGKPAAVVAKKVLAAGKAVYQAAAALP